MLSETPNIPEHVGMTPMERRLARRVHNQRRRLKQLEQFKNWKQFGWKLRQMYTGMYRKAAERQRAAEQELAAFKAGRPFWHRLLDHFNVKP